MTEDHSVVTRGCVSSNCTMNTRVPSKSGIHYSLFGIYTISMRHLFEIETILTQSQDLRSRYDLDSRYVLDTLSILSRNDIDTISSQLSLMRLS